MGEAVVTVAHPPVQRPLAYSKQGAAVFCAPFGFYGAAPPYVQPLDSKGTNRLYISPFLPASMVRSPPYVLPPATMNSASALRSPPASTDPPPLPRVLASFYRNKPAVRQLILPASMERPLPDVPPLGASRLYISPFLTAFYGSAFALRATCLVSMESGRILITHPAASIERPALRAASRFLWKQAICTAPVSPSLKNSGTRIRYFLF